MSDPAHQIIALYRRHALAWTNARGTRLIEANWLDRFCALLHPLAGVLDIGCGSGVPIAAALVERGFAVTGVDSAPEMIAMFARNLPGQMSVTADMRHLQLGRRFGGILAWDSFFHLAGDDQRRMFPVFAAHAVPGAALMFTSGPDAGVAIGLLEGEPLFHASLAADEYRLLLEQSGFAVVAHIAEDANCGGHTVWLAQRER